LQKIEKIRIKFKTTQKRKEYWSQNLHLKNGETALVHPKIGQKLLNFFPENFEEVIVKPETIGKKQRPKLKLSQISLVCIVNKPKIFERNLKTSIPKEVEFIKLDNENNCNWTSASKALNYGIKKSRNEVVICAHQDIKFHISWWENFLEQECRLKDWGILGGVGIVGNKYKLTWGYNLDKPIKANSLDECLIVVNKKNNIWFDEKTFNGWHLYAADFCLQCKEKGLGIYILAGEFQHNWLANEKSRSWLEDTVPYRKKLSQKWKQRIVTTIGEIT